MADMTPKEALEELQHKVFYNTDNCEMTISKDCYKNIVNALEKRISKKPIKLKYQLLIDSGWEYGCPSCGCAVGKNKNVGFAYEEYLEPYEDCCQNCGQALNWSDTNG